MQRKNKYAKFRIFKSSYFIVFIAELQVENLSRAPINFRDVTGILY